MSPDQLAAIRARWEAATPGPWRWGGQDGRDYRLESLTSMLPQVMGFRRLGMNGAMPVFWHRDGRAPSYVTAKDITVREVPYRGDVVALANADAEAIAHAPSDTAALLVEVGRLRTAITEHRAHYAPDAATYADELLWAVLEEDPNG